MICPAIRCSGEMNTSLGNTISNYLSIQVAARYLGCSVKCVVEGDDALIEVPQDLSKADYQRCMERMGFNIKIDEYTSPSEAGFCHLHWDDNGRPVQEVVPRLPDLFWGDNKSLTYLTHSELLAAKLASLANDDPCTPCLWKFFKDGEVSQIGDLYHMEKLGAHVSGHLITFRGVSGECPDNVHRDAFALINHLSVADQLMIESQNLTLEETVDAMYRNATDVRFAENMCYLQVQN